MLAHLITDFTDDFYVTISRCLAMHALPLDVALECRVTLAMGRWGDVFVCLCSKRSSVQESRSSANQPDYTNTSMAE